MACDRAIGDGFWHVATKYWSNGQKKNNKPQYEPKIFCLPGGSQQAPLSAGVSFCLQTGVAGALLTPQYGTPSMRADGN